MKDLTNSKIWIGTNPELSEKVQKRLFELKITWSNKYTTVIAKTSSCLFISFDKEITHSSKNKEEFDKDSRKEIFLSDLFDEEDKDFPTEGYCESLDIRLTTYLKSRPNNISEHKEITPSCIGTAWNSNSYWYIISSSSKKEYKLESLLKFMKETWIPKRNDWVIITESNNSFNEKMRLLVGKCVQLTSTNGSGFYIEEDGGMWSWQYNKNHFRKALPHEIPNQEEDLSEVPYTEWRVGDTIERTVNGDDANKVTKGRNYIILEFKDKSNGWFADDDNKRDHFHLANFKLVKRASNQSEDTFVLPEEWYVRVTEQNKAILSKWRGTSLSPGKITGMYILYGSKTPSKEHDSGVSSGWKKEITFEQFQKYVLKTIPNNLTNNNLNKQENVNTKQSSSKESSSCEESNNQGIKIRRSNISISEGIGIRGSSLKSSRSKIHVGSNNSYN